MKTTLLLRTTLAALCFAALAAGTASADIIYQTVTVGNAGNVADTTTGYGSVAYTYQIGKYDVTLSQYTAFLNAVAATDTYGLYNPNMETNLNIAGIARTGTSGSYTYTVIGEGNRPVTMVSWFDAVRFSNWVHNGQPVGLQISGTTETGAYTLNGATSGIGFTKNVNAQYWIPSENEWYKAAYYDPTIVGTNKYWQYATQSNTQPNSRNGSVSDPNSANYYYNDGIANGYNGGRAVTNSTDAISSQNYLTVVGAFTQADSYYGTYDQNGNVWQWNDAIILSNYRGMRGGSFASQNFVLQPSYRINKDPTSESSEFGFRLASSVIAPVPEPTGTLTGLLCLGVAAMRRRGRSAVGIFSGS